jgi:hypothetical protein
LQVDIEHSWFLLDAHFVVHALLELPNAVPPGDEGAAAVRALLLANFITSWSTASSLRTLAQPLLHQQLPAAVSLALLSREGDHFRIMLAGASRLETLLSAFACSHDHDEASAPPPQQHSGNSEWQRQALHTAVKTAVDSAGMTAPATATATDAGAVDAPPAAKRQRTAGFALRAEDVNAQRRDSTVLLIAGQPFYVNGTAIESKSPVLADALRDATTLDPIPLPLPRGVPAEQHYAVFRAAVEHTYTGTVAAMESALLLPLWCLGDHLQMDELRAWCIERMTPLLKIDADMLEAAWAAALARPCDALCNARASAWLVSVSAAAASDTAPLKLLARMQAGCAAGVSLTVQTASALRAALQPAAAAAAGAAAGV